jgi:hypothetical protein
LQQAPHSSSPAHSVQGSQSSACIKWSMAWEVCRKKTTLTHSAVHSTSTFNQVLNRTQPLQPTKQTFQQVPTMAYKARRLILSPLHLQTEASSTTFLHLQADHGTNLASSWSTVKVLIRLLWCHLLYRTFNSYLPRSPEILSSSYLAQNHDFHFQHQRSPLKKT